MYQFVVLFSPYLSTAFATETAIVMTKLPGVLYKAKLNVNSPDVKHLANLSATATRCVYNKFTNEIVWGEGNLIKTLSLSDGGTPSTINGKSILYCVTNE